MDIPPLDRRGHPPGARFSLWAAGDGWSIRRMDWPQAEGAAVRGSILFANGRGDFVEKYLEPLGHWHARGWNVLSFDWRGQGDSRATIVGGNFDDFDPLVADLDAMVREWIASTPAPHVLVGHSMGGHLVLRLLAERQPAVDAAVLSAPMVGINTAPVPAALGRRIARFLSRLGFEALRLSGKVGRQSYLTTCPDRYADEAWWKGQQPGYDLGPPSWGWLHAAFTSMDSVTPERLRHISMPVLLIGTDTDRLVSAAAIRAAAAAMPRVELHMFPDAAHEILRESDPVRLETYARIDDFLDRHAPA